MKNKPNSFATKETVCLEERHCLALSSIRAARCRHTFQGHERYLLQESQLTFTSDDFSLKWMAMHCSLGCNPFDVSD